MGITNFNELSLFLDWKEFQDNLMVSFLKFIDEGYIFRITRLGEISDLDEFVCAFAYC